MVSVKNALVQSTVSPPGRSTESLAMKLHGAWRRRDPDREFRTVFNATTYLQDRMQRTDITYKSVQKMPIRSDQHGVFIQGRERLDFTYLSFTQLCRILHNHPKCVRRYSPSIVQAMLTEELKQRYTGPSHHRVMTRPEHGQQLLCAINGSTYGTIWDYEILAMVAEIDVLNQWVPPCEVLGAGPQATTLYAGDDGLYCFLLDKARPIALDQEVAYAGVLLVNSEVGTHRFEVSSFVYLPHHDIRFPYRVEGIDSLLIRHSTFGPHRFAEAAPQILGRFKSFAPTQLEAHVKLARKQTLGRAKEKVIEVLRTRFALTEKLAKEVVDTAEQHFNDFRSAWALVNALCVLARDKHGAKTSDRLPLERTAQRLLTAYSK